MASETLGNDFFNVQIGTQLWPGPQAPPMNVTFVAHMQIWTGPAADLDIVYNWIVCASVGATTEANGGVCTATGFGMFNQDFTYSFVLGGFPWIGPNFYTVTVEAEDNLTRRLAASTAVVYLTPQGEFTILASGADASVNKVSVFTQRPPLGGMPPAQPVAALGFAYQTSNPVTLNLGLIGFNSEQVGALAYFTTVNPALGPPNLAGTPQCAFNAGVLSSNLTLDVASTSSETCDITFVYVPGMNSTGSCSTVLYMGTIALGPPPYDSFGNTSVPLCWLLQDMHETVFSTLYWNSFPGAGSANEAAVPAFAQGYINVTVTSAPVVQEVVKVVTNPFVLAGGALAAAVAIGVYALRARSKRGAGP